MDGNKYFYSQNAFTIIELLVVIAVIGLLSSVVLIAIKDNQENAREKKSMQFSASIQHSLGAYALGIWSFENNLNDTSGNENNGSWVGATGSFINGAVNKAVQLSASGDISVPASEKLLSKNGAITTEFWFNVSSITNSYRYALSNINRSTLFYPYYNIFYCYIYSSNFYCRINDFSSSGFLRTAYFSISGIVKPNQWLHVVLTCNSSNLSSLKVYFNTEEYSPVQNTLEICPLAGGPLYIGSYSSSGRLGGKMDEVRIYDSYISLSEAKKHYAEGLFKIKLKEFALNK